MKQMKTIQLRKQVSAIVGVIVMATSCCGCDADKKIEARVAVSPRTFCNPVNLDYRFMKIEGGEGIREAADPVVVSFKDHYYLFASKSSGYWYSDDFTDWKHVFIPDSVLPIEDYAPAIFVHDEYVYYVGSTRGKGMLYRSAAPEKGEWEPVKEIWSYWDPAFYVEGEHLYVYYGSSPVDPICKRVLDLNTLEETEGEKACFNSNMETYGWERPGERNELTRRPYIEGAWMTAHGGNYYLQYAAPGTEWDTYADGTYVSDSPDGPFTYMPNSPVSYKPAGFIGGAGHGCLFTVAPDVYWKAATNSISVRHMFERRLSFYPAGFDQDGYLFTRTYLGDFPMFLPTVNSGETHPGWMLLSYRKPVTASSSLADYPVSNLVDEKVRTAWVASSNRNSEWVQIDLEQTPFIHAIQVNFDEYGATQSGVVPGVYQSYVIEASWDGEKWYTVADYSQKTTDHPHDYIEFEEPFQARYIRFCNRAYTVSDHLSLRELRVFGKGMGEKPQPVTSFAGTRSQADPCQVELHWEPVPEAQGYIVRYGIAPDKLYLSYQVMDGSTLEMGSLNKDETYYFAIDVFNENGITPSEQTLTL